MQRMSMSGSLRVRWSPHDTAKLPLRIDLTLGRYKDILCIVVLCPRPHMDTELLKGTLSLLILSLLSRKAMYGYEIAATVHRDTDGTFTWREGSLYPSLHKLEADGLVAGQWEEKETGRKRKYYHITE